MPDPPVARVDPPGGPRPPPTFLPGLGEGPRYTPGRYGYLVWLVPAAVPVLALLAILLGALWR